MEFTGTHFVMDLLLHIAFIGVAIPIMFFTYGTQLQKELVKHEVYKIVHDFLRPLMGVVTYIFKDFTWEIETSASEKKQEERNELIRNKVKYVLITMFAVSIGLFGVMVVLSNEPVPWGLIGTNLVMTVMVVAAEIVFIRVVVEKFRPIDVDDIQQRLIQKLEKAAAATKH